MERKPAIDISVWDEGIDIGAWKRDHGIWAVIVKCGGNEGGRYRDRCFDSHYDKVVAEGLHVGAYYYTTSTTEEAARADAEHCVGLLKGKKLDMPVFMDVEDNRQFSLSARKLTDVIKAFCDRVNELGYVAGLYTGGNAWNNNMYPEELRKYAIWIASWQANWPGYVGEIDMWQQGTKRLSDGSVHFEDLGTADAQDFDWVQTDWPSIIGGDAPQSVDVGGCLSYQDMFAEVAEHIANHDAHGYSQPNRAGDGTIETITLSDGTNVNVHGADYDCSEMARMCVAAAGVLPWDYWESYMWTENQYDVLTSHGFTRLPFDWSDTRRGDILWVKGHTGIALGNGLQADAHGDEYGGITGPNEGDQTGHEIEVRDLQWYWTYTYRYVGSARKNPKPTPVQVPGEPVNDLGVRYCAHCKDIGWQDWVHDGQTAGTTGFSCRAEAFMIRMPKGVKFDAIVHVQNIGSLYFEDVTPDMWLGTTGQSLRAEALRIRIKSLPKSLKGKSIHVQAHVKDLGWLDPVGDDEWAGTLGESRRLEAVRIWIA